MGARFANGATIIGMCLTALGACSSDDDVVFGPAASGFAGEAGRESDIGAEGGTAGSGLAGYAGQPIPIAKGGSGGTGGGNTGGSGASAGGSSAAVPCNAGCAACRDVSRWTMTGGFCDFCIQLWCGTQIDNVWTACGDPPSLESTCEADCGGEAACYCACTANLEGTCGGAYSEFYLCVQQSCYTDCVL